MDVKGPGLLPKWVHLQGLISRLIFIDIFGLDGRIPPNMFRQINTTPFRQNKSENHERLAAFNLADVESTGLNQTTF